MSDVIIKYVKDVDLVLLINFSDILYMKKGVFQIKV